MIVKSYSHKNGELVVPETKTSVIENILRDINIPLRPRCATAIRSAITDKLCHQGWSVEVRIHVRHQLTLTATNGLTALCLQTGNMARFYADLLKIQAQFIDGKIDSAVYILPTAQASRIMGENMANFERLTRELRDIFASVITTPILIYGFEEGAEGG